MKIGEIKPYEKNAKKHPEKQLRQIANSLKRFGWQQPIKVGNNNVIIAGHGRWFAYKKYPDGIKDPWIIDEEGNTISGEPEKRKLTQEEEKAYRLADNKLNESGWDMDFVLEDFNELDSDLQELTGFEDIEKDNEDILGEIEFTEELLESSNYVVLYFDNEVDWLNAQTLFDLKVVKALNSKPTFEKKGVGRVLNGVKALQKLNIKA